MVTKAINVTFAPSCSRMSYSVSLPAGLRVKKITEGGTAGNYFLDEFPRDLFPLNSVMRHDAIHYGIVLSLDQVMES